MSKHHPAATPPEAPDRVAAEPTVAAPPVHRSVRRYLWVAGAGALAIAATLWLALPPAKPIAEQADERQGQDATPRDAAPTPAPPTPVPPPVEAAKTPISIAPSTRQAATTPTVVPEAPKPEAFREGRADRREQKQDSSLAQDALASVSSGEFEVSVQGGVEGGIPGGVPGGTGVVAPVEVPAPRRWSPPSPHAPPPAMAPVNGEPYPDMYFESAGTNPFVDTEDDHLSTFGLEVDTASFTLARRYLRDGHLPPADAVRVEEFVNYFDYQDAPPTDGRDFALYAEGAPSPFAESERYHLLRLALRGREVAAADRAPATLIFVVDVSGSMDMENRLGLVRRSLHLLVDQLRGDDRVGLVVYGSRGEVRLEPTGDLSRIRAEIDALLPAGSTNAGEGLQLAYELAARHQKPRTIHRLILCSDGVANTGVTEAQAILDRVSQHARQGIELTTVGFGMGNYNDTLMEKLADNGNGRYAYVDEIGEARRIFVESLTGTLQTLAAEARVQVDFDKDLVRSWRLLGYENRDIADERFRDDTIDAGEIGAGHAVTALYEIKTTRAPRAGETLATFTVRYASVAAGKMVEQKREIVGRDLVERWDDALPALRLAGVVAELAEVLKNSYWARRADLDQLFRRSQRVAVEFEGRTDIAELAALIGKVAQLRKPEGHAAAPASR